MAVKEYIMTYLNLDQSVLPETSDAGVAPDCQGLNFFDIDKSLQDLMGHYLPDDLREHMTPHYQRLGEVAGTELDALSRQAERHIPVLHTRDPMGRDQDWIEIHPAYKAMEQIAFGDFGIHCMSRKSGVLGWQGRVPPSAKYIFQYIFTQAEFGLMCPVSVTDTSALLVEKYADEATKSKFLDRMLSQDMNEIYKSAQFMTEKSGGSDVSGIELEARNEDGVWRLYGEKWFCSCVDGDVALLLARPEGAPEGNAGLALFAMPRHLDDGTRNSYRTVRLKDKLGTRSMASGEIIFNGAVAYALGEAGAGINRGLKQMMDQVSLSRLSHGVRAAGMMRRCLNESLVVANSRRAFGETLIEKPLLRRQLMKLMVPTEQVLSMVMYIARELGKAEAGDEAAAKLVRILTPLVKFRACRDNITVATGAMEVRGGNGFIEDWINSRLIRDAHVGVLWEGTSNINSLDITNRAIARFDAHEDLSAALQDMISGCSALPGQYAGILNNSIENAVAFAEKVAKSGTETLARKASDALYHATTATILAEEGATLGANGGDARRLLLSRMVVDHRIRPQDPLGFGDTQFEKAATDALLSNAKLSLEQATDILAL